MQAEQDRQRASCEPYLIVSRGERGGDAGSMPEGVDLRWVGRWVATSRDGGGRCCVGGVGDVEGRRWALLLLRRGCCSPWHVLFVWGGS